MSEVTSEKQIEAIAKALADRKENDAAKRQRAGITYLGQFISHDIVPATNPNRQSRNVTPYLDLGSIYGDNNEYLNSEGLFPIRPVRDSSNKIVGYDVPRKLGSNGSYPASIAEARNDDVTIVTQLHAFFQRLHNAIIRSGYAVDTKEAKEFTIKIFQVLVVEEFCKNILDKSVFISYFQHGISNYNLWNKSEVPAFFSKAAFRFGHSMVRAEYALNHRLTSISLPKLFTTNQKLEAKKAIEWSRFFNETANQDMNNDKGGQPAMLMDTNFSTITQMVSPIDQSFDPINLIIRNLEGGESSKLPTGLAVAAEVYNRTQEDLSDDNELWFGKYPASAFAQSIKKNGGLTKLNCLPLWPFILVEAELDEKREHYKYDNDGRNECLGKVGSTLVAEVLLNAIANSDFSIFVRDKYNLDAAIKSMGEFGNIIKPKSNSSFNFMHIQSTLETIEGN